MPHQSVDDLGDGLRVVGRADDGTIEAIEAISPDDPPFSGVPWHPEPPVERQPHRRLLGRLVARASATSVPSGQPSTG